jgi:hypothetical protein
MKEPVNKLTFNHQLLAGSLKVFKKIQNQRLFYSENFEKNLDQTFFDSEDFKAQNCRFFYL